MLGRLFGPERRSVSEGEYSAALYQARRGGGGVPVSADRAMQLSTVWACYRILAGIGSTLPLDQLRRIDGKTSPMTRASFWDEPVSGQPLSDWLHRLWMSALTTGNVYGIVTSESTTNYRIPKSVELIPSASVRWVRDSAGMDIPMIGNQTRTLWPKGDLWHLPLFTVAGSPEGLNPLRYAATTIGAGLSAVEFGAKWYTDGGHPSAVITADQELTQAEAQKVKDSFREATQGNREPAVFGAGLTYEAIQVAPNESQFLEAIGANARQIAALIGVPAEWIGEAGGSRGSVTYANREQRWQDFLTIDLMPYLVKIEDGLSRLLTPATIRMKHNLDAVLRSDLAGRYASYKLSADVFAATGVPILTSDEMRDFEGLAPLPDSAMTRPPTAPPAAPAA